MLKIGTRVKTTDERVIREYGEFGTITVVDNRDAHMPYMVKFDGDTDDDGGMWMEADLVEQIEREVIA
ncbi:MAG TPA: hypothetical protein VN258_06435 [Mobilitalea sp.]|nr:hypothetical protein [Mobilitalea sp.]